MATSAASDEIVSADDCKQDDNASLQRILQLLDEYNKWLNQNQSNNQQSIYSITQNYAITDIIEDYQHIKSLGNNSSSNLPRGTKSPKDSIPLKRHCRDYINNPNQVYGTNEIKEIVLQRMLDQIYLFIYYPLVIVTEDTDNSRPSRFCAVIEEQEQKLVKEKESSVIDINPERDAYNFGQQFFYWDYYQHHEWFIKQKYDNFKEELLNNDMCNIDQFEWNLEYENAVYKLEQDPRTKALRSNGEFKDKYGIDENIAITMDHLLSILFYCNTNELQSVFSATYRRLAAVNESDEEFKYRHSHYYHFGKLLRETVEVYGQLMIDEGSCWHKENRI